MSDKLQLIRKEFPPPDGYRYKFPQDGIVVKCNTYGGWRQKMADHARWNEYPTPPMEDADDQLCRLLPPGLCMYGDGTIPTEYLDARVGISDILNGTKVLASWVAEGAPLVEQELAESRGKTCASCYAAMPIAGCAPCVGLANVVAEVAGARTTEADAYLETKSCAVCKCSARAQIWLPIEILAKGMTSEMDKLWPGHCWKANERNEMLGTKAIA